MDKLIVSTSPHIRHKATTASIMRDVIIALLPASVAAVIFFGFKALLMIAVCVGCAVASEFLFNLICKKKQTVGDLSAIVTGLLLALNLSTNVTLWQCAVGSVFAIVIVKCVFGGIGHNFANPAATARVFLLVAFSGSVAGGAFANYAEITSSATPLAIMQAGGTNLPSLLDMFLGNIGGAIGETSALAILIGFVYLLIRKVINWQTPAIFVGTVFVLSLVFKQDVTLALYQVLGGGLLLGAVFMATDYSTTPINKRGKAVFALGCGILTFIIRSFGAYPEGVSFSILIMNILAPYIERLTAKRPFGGAKNVKK
ncbi:MAG: RnfABCDGE type electron transport complex subunit D [Clostridia bacterium]|nr:RnfABCDGE type electron transport complex subunit D [Clostridia bacterium]